MKTATDSIKTALNAITYLPNAVFAWEQAHGGDKKLSKANAEKLRQAEQLLGEVLGSMPSSKEYFVVGVGRFASEEALLEALTKLGIRRVGSAGGHLRPEMVGAPTFDKLIGPIYDGAGVCRYETQETYDFLSRRLVWWQHKLLLGEGFASIPHVFLASRTAADVAALRALRVPPDHIWAVEVDPEQYKPLLNQARLERFRVFPRKVESVVEDYPNHFLSVYLDFCGNFQGTAKSLRRVVSKLPSSSVLSVTLFLGREQGLKETREQALLSLIRQSSCHPVTLIQSVKYWSSSPMMTWTFRLSKATTRGVLRFKLDSYAKEALGMLARSERLTLGLWAYKVQESRLRSAAAVKANQTRRL